ncbi:MAG: TonB-dependent receptor [Maribacter sp.]|nr:TonB-dependent receptor [Maribacter sp.]
MKKIFLYSLLVLGFKSLTAQQDPTIKLEEVVVSDSRLLRFSSGVKVEALKDSVLQSTDGSLTNALLYNSNLYFKENGYGMVSSPSFRGTGAAQTAVIWNGINVNSQLTGQTDFNTILPQNFDKISIRSGGGSTQYGTGAVGGSIHLENTLNFNNPWAHRIQLGYGSFSTRNLSYKSKFGSEKAALSIGIGHYASANDYKYLGTSNKNENGAFFNSSLDIGYGILINPTNILKLHHATFLGDRDLSGTLTAPSNSNYKDVNSRSLLEWANFKDNRIQRVKAAYLYERYRFYLNKNSNTFSFGNAKSLIVNYDLKYELKNAAVNGILDYNNIRGEGTAIQNANRNLFATTLLFSHTPTKRFSYGINLRKDWVNDYVSPFVYAMDGKYDISNAYTITFNASKNFRIPTFNDLYWEGSAAGNKDLKPETSSQAELGQIFTKNGLTTQLNLFYITTNDLIQWRPDSFGVWSPDNVKEVYQYGLESSIRFNHKFKEHDITGQGTYAYTRAIDKDTDNQLIYVPLHKVTASIAYQYKKWGLIAQSLYNGKVFTTTDNAEELDGYFLVNLLLEHSIADFLGTDVKAAIRVNNLFNINYQNVAFRPMPNRNFQLQLNFKF